MAYSGPQPRRASVYLQKRQRPARSSSRQLPGQSSRRASARRHQGGESIRPRAKRPTTKWTCAAARCCRLTNTTGHRYLAVATPRLLPIVVFNSDAAAPQQLYVIAGRRWRERRIISAKAATGPTHGMVAARRLLPSPRSAAPASGNRDATAGKWRAHAGQRLPSSKARPWHQRTRADFLPSAANSGCPRRLRHLEPIRHRAASKTPGIRRRPMRPDPPGHP